MELCLLAPLKQSDYFIGATFKRRFYTQIYWHNAIHGWESIFSYLTCATSIFNIYIYVLALHPVCDICEEIINVILDGSSSIHITIGMYYITGSILDLEILASYLARYYNVAHWLQCNFLCCIHRSTHI